MACSACKTFGKAVFHGSSSLVRITRTFAAGDPLVVLPPEREARLKACEECDERIGTRCGRCTCFVKLKSWLVTEKCEKWPKP